MAAQDPVEGVVGLVVYATGHPEEAVQGHLDLHSKMSIGTHFGTLQLTDEGIDEPIKTLEVALQKLKVPSEHFVAPEIGQTFLFGQK